MKGEKRVKQMISSLVKENEKVLVIDRKENWDRWHEFKCLIPGDISTLPDDSFDLVVVNDFKGIKSDFLRQLKRIGNKFIILSPFVTKITDSSKQLIEGVTKNDLDEVKFLDKIIDQGEVLKRKRLEYIMLEKEDLAKTDSSNNFFNLAMIQNLKAQIVEREKKIATKNKDIEILENRKDQLEKDLAKLRKEIVRINKEKDEKIKKLNEQREKQIAEFKSEINEQREKQIAEFKSEITKLTQEKDEKIKKLNEQREKQIKELIFDFGQRLEEKTQEIKKLRENFERRKKELEEEKNRLIEAKDKEIKRMGKELEKFKSIAWFKLFSKISKFRK